MITPSEMWHFYEEQMKRLEGLSQEPVLFEDVLCQLHDMLQVGKQVGCRVESFISDHGSIVGSGCCAANGFAHDLVAQKFGFFLLLSASC